jgi:hypothetical protein
MKITPGMAEAGVNAMARAKRTPIGDSAVVAMIYSAMDLVRRQEEANQKPTTPQKYQHQDWPAFHYGPNGESKVFAKAGDVPEGWSDSPISEEVHVLERDQHIKRGPGRPRRAAA